MKIIFKKSEQFSLLHYDIEIYSIYKHLFLFMFIQCYIQCSIMRSLWRGWRLLGVAGTIFAYVAGILFLSFVSLQSPQQRSLRNHNYGEVGLRTEGKTRWITIPNIPYHLTFENIFRLIHCVIVSWEHWDASRYFCNGVKN